MNKRRQKRTCWGCRAISVSALKTICSLDYEITIGDGGFYVPAKGERCPKPSTYRELDVLKSGIREGRARQISLFSCQMGGGSL